MGRHSRPPALTRRLRYYEKGAEWKKGASKDGKHNSASIRNRIVATPVPSSSNKTRAKQPRRRALAEGGSGARYSTVAREMKVMHRPWFLNKVVAMLLI